MKTTHNLMLTALTLGLASTLALAQDQRPPADGGGRPPREGRGPGGPGGPGGRMVPPLMAALDANGDGVIDETEIANAPAALRKLDKNGDGKLTVEEIRPAGGPGGPGGEGQRGPRGPRPGDENRPPRQRPQGE